MLKEETEDCGKHNTKIPNLVAAGTEEACVHQKLPEDF